MWRWGFAPSPRDSCSLGRISTNKPYSTACIPSLRCGELRLTADADPNLFPAKFLGSERRGMPEPDFNREYLGIPGGNQTSPFGWDLYDRAT